MRHVSLIDESCLTYKRVVHTPSREKEGENTEQEREDIASERGKGGREIDR